MEEIKFLEFIKYFTLIGHNVWFKSSGEFINYIKDDTLITTPEGYTFTIKMARVNMGTYFTGLEELKFDLRNPDIDNSANPLNLLIPEINGIDVNISNNSYKKYVFGSEYYFYLKHNKENEWLKIFNSHGIENTSSDYFPFTLVILIKSTVEDINNFTSFLNMSYEFWKATFDFIVNTLNIEKILNYDSRIFSNELNSTQAINLLESFQTINLPNEYIISILDLKNEKAKIELINYLRNSDTNLNYRLMQHFLNDSSIEDFYKYNEALMNLGVSLINQTSVEIIAQKEVECYTNFPNAEWNLFNKLAESAGVFAISTNTIYNTHFGIFNYFPTGAVVELNPFNTQFLPSLPNIPEVNVDFKKIHFAYSSIYKVDSQNDDSNKIVRFPSIDPFKLVKLYIVNEPNELKEVEKYGGFIKQFLSPKECKIKVAYIPAISAYNLYVLNFRAQHDVIAAQLLQGTLLALGTALTFGLTSPFTTAWYLGTVANMSSILAMTINIPGVKEEIFNQFGQENGQEFIDAIDFLANATIALDFAHAGFYGIRNFGYFVTNHSAINLAKETFYLRYFQLNLRLRKILMPFYESIGKNIDLVKIQELEFEILINPHLVSGKTWGWVKNFYKINNEFPPLNDYIKQSSQDAYNLMFQTEGSITFFCTKRGIMKYDFLPQGRFAGLTNHMEIIESNFYKSGKNIEQLKNDLKVEADKFLIEDEIYMIKVNFQDGYIFEMPIGATSGTNIEKWLPGGFLPSIKNLESGEIFFPRETIFFKNNGGNSIINYGDDFQLFLNSFGNGNYKRIYP